MTEILTNNLLSILQTNSQETSTVSKENSFFDTGKNDFENVLSELNEKLNSLQNKSSTEQKIQFESSEIEKAQQNVITNKEIKPQQDINNTINNTEEKQQTNNLSQTENITFELKSTSVKAVDTEDEDTLTVNTYQNLTTDELLLSTPDFCDKKVKTEDVNVRQNLTADELLLPTLDFDDKKVKTEDINVRQNLTENEILLSTQDSDDGEVKKEDVNVRQNLTENEIFLSTPDFDDKKVKTEDVNVRQNLTENEILLSTLDFCDKKVKTEDINVRQNLTENEILLSTQDSDDGEVKTEDVNVRQNLTENEILLSTPDFCDKKVKKEDVNVRQKLTENEIFLSTPDFDDKKVKTEDINVRQNLTTDETKNNFEQSTEIKLSKTENEIFDDKKDMPDKNNAKYQKNENAKIELKEETTSNDKFLIHPQSQNECLQAFQTTSEGSETTNQQEQIAIPKDNSIAQVIAKSTNTQTIQVQNLKDNTKATENTQTPITNTISTTTTSFEQKENTLNLNELDMIESIEIQNKSQQELQKNTQTLEANTKTIEQTEVATEEIKEENSEKIDSKPQLENNDSKQIKKIDLEFETNSDTPNKEFKNSSSEIKLIAENLSEKNAFLSSDKSIIFNKILDRSVATTASQTTQTTGKSDVLNQLNQGLNNLSNENSKVNIILRPESLGKVSVELQNGKDGLVAKFAVESAQIKEILDKSVENLKNTLNNQGVNVNNISIKVETLTNAQNSGFFEFAENSFEQNAQTNSQNQNPNSSNSTTKTSIQEENHNQSEETEQTVQTNTTLGQIDYTI